MRARVSIEFRRAISLTLDPFRPPLDPFRPRGLLELISRACHFVRVERGTVRALIARRKLTPEQRETADALLGQAGAERVREEAQVG
jgi:hypothetical protein